MTFAAIAFAVGAATGNRPAAAGAAAALAVAGYVLEGLAQQIPALRPARSIRGTGCWPATRSATA